MTYFIFQFTINQFGIESLQFRCNHNSPKILLFNSTNYLQPPTCWLFRMFVFLCFLFLIFLLVELCKYPLSYFFYIRSAQLSFFCNQSKAKECFIVFFFVLAFLLWFFFLLHLKWKLLLAIKKPVSSVYSWNFLGYYSVSFVCYFFLSF